MYFPISCWLVLFFCLLPPFSTSATPVQPPVPGPNLNNGQLECSSAGPYTAACWNSLNIPHYYRNWTAANDLLCESRGLGQDLAACFIQVTTGETFSCNLTGDDSDELRLCPLAQFDLKGFTSQEAYVLRAIYGFWKWFQSISTAIKSTDLIPGAQLIAAQFDRPKSPFRLEFIALWIIMAAGVLDTPLPGSNSTIVTAYMEEARVNPHFGRVDDNIIEFQIAPFAVPYLEATFDWNPIDDFNRSAIQQYRQIMNFSLGRVQGAVTPWLALTANGSFAADLNRLTADTSNLFKPFYLWILSQWMQQTSTDEGVMATVSRNTDPKIFHKYEHDSRFPISCDYYEANNICSAWWHSKTDNVTFSLTNLNKGKSSKNYYQAMKTLFGNNLFSGNDLFINLDICQRPASFVVRDGKTINCLVYAGMQFAEFSSTCDDRECEFGKEVQSQVDWEMNECFPASYLGDQRAREGNFTPC